MDFLDFPLVNLNLSKFLRNDIYCRYKLYSVINHNGSSYTRGHYTNYSLNFLDENWYCFDDSKITKLQKNEVKTKNAYLLFYKLN